MTLKYFSREDVGSIEALERKRRALLVQLHPDKMGSSKACEEMLAEYAQILQQLKSKGIEQKNSNRIEVLLGQLPEVLRSVGIAPENVKAIMVEKAKEVVEQALDDAWKKVFDFLNSR